MGTLGSMPLSSKIFDFRCMGRGFESGLRHYMYSPHWLLILGGQVGQVSVVQAKGLK